MIDAGTPPPDLCPDVQKLDQDLGAVVVGANTSGSATSARELIADLQKAPRPADVQPQDFINYYAPAFSATSATEPSLHLSLAKSELPSYYELLVAVAAPMLAERPSAALTLAVDNTESIGERGLARVQAALTSLGKTLAAGDKVALITATPSTETFEINGPNDAAFAEAVKKLALAPESSVHTLLGQAYSQARSIETASGWNRVALFSDGEGAVEQLAAPPTSGDLRVAAFGVAPGFSHELLRNVAQRGRGPYVYLDSVDEAARLESKFSTLFGVAFDKLGLELTVPWFFELERPFKGSVSETPTASEPEYIAPGGAMIFAFRLKACDPEIVNYYPSAALRLSVTFGGDTGRTAPLVASVSSLLAQATPELDKVFAVITYAEALQSLDPRRLENAYRVVGTAGLPALGELLLQHPAFPSAAGDAGTSD